MTSIQEKLEQRARAFAQDIASLVNESLQEKLRGIGHGSARARPGARRAARTGIRSLRPGQKRRPEAIAKITEALFAAIKKDPGRRIELIAEGMGVSTRDLMLPIKKLLRARRVSSRGQKRATTYSAR